MIFLINQLNQIRIFFVQKSHHTNFLHDWWVGYPPSPRPSPFNLHSVLYILNTFMHCQIVMRIQTHRLKWTRWYFMKMVNSFFMCVFKFIHSCVWKGCVISSMFFSYVSSNRISEKKHSHIGCICLTFLHCTMALSIEIEDFQVFQSKCLVFAQFWSKSDHSFLTGVKP